MTICVFLFVLAGFTRYDDGMFKQGLVQIYTGNGKGKTTAAFGLALRAAGHGVKVLIYQFLKPADLTLGERGFMDAHCEGVTVRWLDEPWDMFKAQHDEAELDRIRASIHDVLQELETAAHEKYYDLIIMDEIVFCVSQKLASVEDIRQLIACRDPGVELVMTGRGASDELIALADLVTEMKLVKHPYDKGVDARKGIEY